jgi:hypothetical protein
MNVARTLFSRGMCVKATECKFIDGIIVAIPTYQGGDGIGAMEELIKIS